MASSPLSDHQTSALIGSGQDPSPFFPAPAESLGRLPMLVRSQTTQSAEVPPPALPLLRSRTEGSVHAAPAQTLMVRQLLVQSPLSWPLSVRSAIPLPSPSPVNAAHWQVVGQRLATALNDPSLLMSPAASPLPGPSASYACNAPPGLVTPVHVGQWQQVGHRMANLLGAATPAASPTNSYLMSPPSSVTSPMHSVAGRAAASQNLNPYQLLLYSYGAFS